MEYSIEEELEEQMKINEDLQQRIDKVIEIAYRYAQINGTYHKMWVIDQMLRELLGNGYDKFVKEYEADDKYTWNTGIAP